MMKLALVPVCSLLALPSTTLAWGFGPSRSQLKTEILQLAQTTKRGLTATEEDKDRMDELFRKLEKSNPTQKPLKNSLVNGVWSLEYTTSDSIVGKGDFPKIGPILQTIDTNNLCAENSEVVSYFGVKVPRKVTAELIPRNDQLTDVQFKQFILSLIHI